VPKGSAKPYLLHLTNAVTHTTEYSSDTYRSVQVTTQLSALACFPTLQIGDVLCEEMPKRATWHMLAIPTLNALLSEPVSDHELWLQAQEEQAGMNLTHVMAELKPVDVSLGPVLLGCSHSVSFQLVNTGRSALLLFKSSAIVCQLSWIGHLCAEHSVLQTSLVPGLPQQ
jgi:hypothetical protein